MKPPGGQRETKSPLSSSSSSSSSSIRIPTVMLMEEDGSSIETAVRHMQSKGLSPPQLQLSITQLPMLLDNSESMGNEEYPKVWAKPKLIHILSRGGWGALLSQTQTSDWELYIVSRKDFRHGLLSWSATSPGGQMKSVPGTISLDPLALYSRAVKRQCEASVLWNGRTLRLV
jgi:hypothetical protein